MDLRADIIRVDLDASKISDLYPARIGIVADAASTASALFEKLAGVSADHGAAERAMVIRNRIAGNLSSSEKEHAKLLTLLDRIAPEDTIWSGDACQLVYTGAFAKPTRGPRRWFYPAGFCALGNALPNAIGAKLARPDCPVAVLAGDGGFMFTMPELMTAAEQKLPIPIVIWDNGGLKQIQDDMDSLGIRRVGVEGVNPDFVALAKACGCDGIEVESERVFKEAFEAALTADKPTVLVVREGRLC